MCESKKKPNCVINSLAGIAGGWGGITGYTKGGIIQVIWLLTVEIVIEESIAVCVRL